MSSGVMEVKFTDVGTYKYQKSFVKFGDPVTLKRCDKPDCTCQSQYHCPFCHPTHFKPTKPCKVQEHLEETHWPLSVQYKEILIVRCSLQCGSETGGHYHCPTCPQLMGKRLPFLAHLRTHLLQQNESPSLAYASDSKQPQFLVYGNLTLRLCEQRCWRDKKSEKWIDHYHCPGCSSLRFTAPALISHIRKCLLSKGNKGSGVHGSPRKRELLTPKIIFPKWHKSIIRNMADITVRRCFSRQCCNRRYHCPLCVYENCVPTSLTKLRQHFAVHSEHFVQHQGYIFLSCRLNCERMEIVDPAPHYHCGYCGLLLKGSEQFKSHLESCQKLFPINLPPITNTSKMELTGENGETQGSEATVSQRTKDTKVITSQQETTSDVTSLQGQTTTEFMPMQGTTAAEVSVPQSKITTEVIESQGKTATEAVATSGETTADVTITQEKTATNVTASEVETDSNVISTVIKVTEVNESQGETTQSPIQASPGDLSDEHDISTDSYHFEPELPETESLSNSALGHQEAFKQQGKGCQLEFRSVQETTEMKETAPLQLFESVTATLASSFLDMVRLHSKDAAETFLKEVAGACSVVFSSTPESSLENSVFAFHGSLQNINKTDSILREKMEETKGGYHQTFNSPKKGPVVERCRFVAASRVPGSCIENSATDLSVQSGDHISPQRRAVKSSSSWSDYLCTWLPREVHGASNVTPEVITDCRIQTGPKVKRINTSSRTLEVEDHEADSSEYLEHSDDSDYKEEKPSPAKRRKRRSSLGNNKKGASPKLVAETKSMPAKPNKGRTRSQSKKLEGVTVTTPKDKISSTVSSQKQCLESKVEQNVANDQPKRYNTRGRRVDTSMFRSRAKQKSSCASEAPSPIKRKKADIANFPAAEKVNEFIAKTPAKKGTESRVKTGLNDEQVFLLKKFPDHLKDCLGTSPKSWQKGNQQVVYYNKIPQCYKSVLTSGKKPDSAIPFSKLPDNIQKMLPKLMTSDVACDKNSASGEEPAVKSCFNKKGPGTVDPTKEEFIPVLTSTGEKLPKESNPVSTREIVIHKKLVGSGFSSNSTQTEYDKVIVREPALKLPEFLKKESLYMPFVQIGLKSPAMELMVDKGVLEEKSANMTDTVQRDIEFVSTNSDTSVLQTLKKESIPDEDVGNSESSESVPALSELEIHLTEKQKNISTVLDADSEKMISDVTEDRKLSCPICEEHIFKKGGFPLHMMASHCKYKCPTCYALFTRKELLTTHVQKVHTPGSRTGKTDSFQQNINREVFRCGDCGKAFRTRRMLDIHQHKNHQYDISCLLCSKIFKSPYNLLPHILCCHTKQNSVMVCDICGKTFKKASYVVAHKKRHFAEKTHPCSVCGKLFKDRSTMTVHEETHKSKDERRFRYVCSYCGKCFLNKTMFTDHTNTHTGNKPYQCKTCGMSFSGGTLLGKHMIVKHSNKRPFKCDLCPKAFRFKNVLKSHMVTHTGVSKYRCTFCQRAFGTAQILRAHIPRCRPQGVKTEMNMEIVDQLQISAAVSSVTEDQSLAEAIQLALDQQNIELHYTEVGDEEGVGIIEETFMYMCSACNATFSDMAMAETHITQCQREEVVVVDVPDQIPPS